MSYALRAIGLGWALLVLALAMVFGSDTFSRALTQDAAAVYTPVSAAQASWFTSGQAADLILGLHGFEESGGPSFLHHPGQLATDGTHLIVADTRNNRVLIWNTIPTTNYAPADVVVGQPDMNSATAGLGPASLDWPVGVATDGTHLIVADSNNHRVLIWNQIPTENGQPADVVVGQPDFYSRDHGAGADHLWWPLSVATDGTRLYVADTMNMRVLIWNTIPTANGQLADVVVGKTDFSAPSGGQPLSQTNLVNPRGVASDGTHLIVSEHHQGNRVLIWNSIPTENGQPADVVLGQPDFDSNTDWGPEQGISSPWQVANDGTRLYSTDGNTRVLIWNQIPTTNWEPPDVVVGQPDMQSNFPALTQEGLGGVWGVASDGQHLFISDTMNSRVLIHNVIPTTNGRPADVVLGQVDFQTNAFISQVGLRTAQGLACDPSHLFIAQDYDARLLVHNAPVEVSNRPADLVLGQPDFTSWGDDPAADPRTSVRPWGMFTDGQRLFVADTGHHRVLIWNSLPTENNAPADLVLGQPDFSIPSSVPGGTPSLGECRSGQDGLCEPRDVMYDGQRLFVADTRNNRVLIWEGLPTANGQPADVVLGQPDFNSTAPGEGASGMNFPTSVFSDGQHLFVTDTYNQRVLVWNTIPTTNGQPADLVLGKSGFDAPPQETFFNLPMGIYSDGVHLFLADNSFHRVLIWNTIPTVSGQPPDIVLGQPDFATHVPATNQDGLLMPTDVCFDGTHLWVSEGKFSDRVVRFSVEGVTETQAVFRVTREGYVYTDGTYYCGLSGTISPPGPPCFNTGSADIAERIDVSEPVEPGDVVEIDPQNPKKYRKSRSPYSTLVVGVIAALPGFVLANLPEELELMELFQGLELRKALLLEALPPWPSWPSRFWLRPPQGTVAQLLGAEAGAEGEPHVSVRALLGWRAPQLPGRPLLALMGRVKVKATTENGPIQPGDLLVSTSLPGYVMRCVDPQRCEGAIVGKALEPLEQGSGLILMLVMH